jgi:nitrate reductase delta subunit
MSSLMRKNGEYREAAARLREWTRERFALPEDAVILVTEIACALPGCPPRETI